MSKTLLLAVVPAIFVAFWSTGWVVARYAVPHADPLTFLSVRYVAAFVCIATFALIVRAPWPKDRDALRHTLVSGMLIHGFYLGSVWYAIKQGVPAGISGLIAALQPLMTAALSGWLIGEAITRRQWFGVAIGFIGVMLVLEPKLESGIGTGTGGLAAPILINILGMLSVTLGSFYQKRYLATGDLRTITGMQYVGALIITLPLAMLIEPMRFDLVPETFYALFWAVVPLSIGAVGLMLLMIRNGAVSRVASLIYLVPPAVAVQTFLLFDERMSPVQIVGLVVAAAGVYLATIKGRA